MTGTSMYTGLTWDHPRGFDALDAAAHAAADSGLQLRWDKQPLEGFESADIGELAQRYDLLVIDHPHLGDALAYDCLTRLDALFDARQLQDWRAQSIGNTFTSYLYGDLQWALPLDAATQVAASRPDLMRRALPERWSEVPDLARSHGFCLSLAGPHAFLTLCSIAHAYGASMGDSQQTLFDGGNPAAAWNMLSQLHAYARPGWQDKNPIALLHAMSASDEVAYCPLVYGYVNYSAGDVPGKRLAFRDVPAGPEGMRGSVLGGTGIAVSRRCRPCPGLLNHLRYLMSPAVQSGFIPRHQGQPSALQAWRDESLNRDFNDFYAGTERTLQTAFVRPRFAGYTRFQLQAADAVRRMLAEGTAARTALAGLESLYRNATQASAPIRP